MRQELIDFAVWIASGHDGIYPGEEAELVDEYLKSINSAQVENPSVGENEQAKEDFSHKLTHSQYYYMGYHHCPMCGELLDE